MNRPRCHKTSLGGVGRYNWRRQEHKASKGVFLGSGYEGVNRPLHHQQDRNKQSDPARTARLIGMRWFDVLLGMLPRTYSFPPYRRLTPVHALQTQLWVAIPAMSRWQRADLGCILEGRPEIHRRGCRGRAARPSELVCKASAHLASPVVQLAQQQHQFSISNCHKPLAFRYVLALVEVFQAPLDVKLY